MFLLLYLLIPAIILMIVNYKLRFTHIYSFITQISTVFYDDVGAGGKKTSYASLSRAGLCLRYAASCLLFVVFFVCICFALAGPRFGVSFTRELRQGADVILVFDLSRSMNVRDAASLPTVVGEGRSALSSSRLERSVYVAGALLEALFFSDAAAVRFGVVMGKGEAILAIPLTSDPEALFALLDSLTDLAFTSRGTNLEKMLDIAGGAFQDNFPAGRSIILFSDGEALSGAIHAAIERLRMRDVRVFPVGVGSVYGAVVPEAGSFESVNSSGKRPSQITSYLRPDTLSNIAERTGGVYIDGNADNAADLLSGNIKSTGAASEDGVWVFRKESSSQRHLFVIAAFIAFALLRLCSLRFRQPP